MAKVSLIAAITLTLIAVFLSCAFAFETKTVFIIRKHGPTEICTVTLLGDAENWICS